MKVTITPAMLASAKTEAGGYTRAQLKVLGIFSCLKVSTMLSRA